MPIIEFPIPDSYGHPEDLLEMVPIADIQVGDELWDEFQWRKVVECEKMKSNPRLVRFTVQSSGGMADGFLWLGTRCVIIRKQKDAHS